MLSLYVIDMTWRQEGGGPLEESEWQVKAEAPGD
jgi:hypothetical protein